MRKKINQEYFIYENAEEAKLYHALKAFDWHKVKELLDEGIPIAKRKEVQIQVFGKIYSPRHPFYYVLETFTRNPKVCEDENFINVFEKFLDLIDNVNMQLVIGNDKRALTIVVEDYIKNFSKENESHYNLLIKSLLVKGADISCVPNLCFSLFIRRCNFKIFKFLLANGLSVNYRIKTHTLVEAVIADNQYISDSFDPYTIYKKVKLLINKGALPPSLEIINNLKDRRTIDLLLKKSLLPIKDISFKDAFTQNSPNLIKELINKGKDVNDFLSESALMTASKIGKVEIAYILIKGKANLNAIYYRLHSETALSTAFSNALESPIKEFLEYDRFYSIVCELYAAGANTSINRYGLTDLISLPNSGYNKNIWQSIVKENYRFEAYNLKYEPNKYYNALIEYEKINHTLPENYLEREIHTFNVPKFEAKGRPYRQKESLKAIKDALGTNNLTKLEDILHQSKNKNGILNKLESLFPLHFVIKVNSYYKDYDYKPLLKFILEKGISVNLQNELGETALHELVTSNPPLYIFKKILRLFFDYGADANITNKEGKKPIDLCDSDVRKKAFEKYVINVNNVVDRALNENFSNQNQVLLAVALNRDYAIEISKEIEGSNKEIIERIVLSHLISNLEDRSDITPFAKHKLKKLRTLTKDPKIADNIRDFSEEENSIVNQIIYDLNEANLNINEAFKNVQTTGFTDANEYKATNAATVIQSWVRGYLCRKELIEMEQQAALGSLNI